MFLYKIENLKKVGVLKRKPKNIPLNRSYKKIVKIPSNKMMPKQMKNGYLKWGPLKIGKSNSTPPPKKKKVGKN